MIGKLTKVSAEEIEMGLITPNDSLAQLHIALLKVFDPHYLCFDWLDFTICHEIVYKTQHFLCFSKNVWPKVSLDCW